MTLPRDALLELMALADGELEGDARARVEKLVAQSGEARQALEAMRAEPPLRPWLAEALEERLRAADGIADEVMSRLGVPGVDRVAAPAGNAPSGLSEGAGVSRRLADIVPMRPRNAMATRVTSAVFAAVAMAAGVAAMWFHSRTDRVASEREPVARVDMPSGEGLAGGGTATSGLEGAAPGRGVVVDEVDTSSREVSIFQITSLANASASSVVVWIEDEPGKP